uniref:Uncharacterized protein n=1 Tax=Aegilops tauschii subsp. strangulata TaxID=200361 RepID=A0A453G0K6_AEGTS
MMLGLIDRWSSYYVVLKMCCFRFNPPYALESREEEDSGDDIESSHASSAFVKPDVEELEMLLEAYFVQFDGTLNKLCHVRMSHLLLQIRNTR